MQSNKIAYIAGAITHLGDESYLQWYEAIGKALEEHGYEAFIPHRDIHSPKHAPTEEIHPRNHQAAKQADLVIAYVGRPSTGVGMTLELAFNEGIRTILLSEKDATLSEMILSLPNVFEHIRFNNKDVAIEELMEVIAQL